MSSATLRLYSHSSTGTGVSLHGVSNGWDELTLTYANAPPIGSAVSKSGPFSPNRWIAIDAKPLVAGNGVVDLALTTTSTSSKTFSSRELASQSPELVVTTPDPRPPPPPPPPPPLAGDPVIAAAGDIACAPTDTSFNGGTGTSTRCRQRHTSDLLVDAGLSGVLALGDLQYENGELPYFQEVFDRTWGRVKSLIRPAPGNHEYGTPGASGYFDYFNGAGGASGPAGDRDKGYHSFDIGSWHLVALNSNCPQVGGCGAGSPQEQWLRADLAAHPRSCTLAYWHHPLFSSGTTGGESMRALWQALYDARAELVLTGHSHHYERFGPQDANGAADSERGVRGFIVGTGGRSHHQIGAVAANSAVRHSGTFGILKLRLRAGAYDWQFVPETGGTFTDSGSGACDSAPADSAPPSTPTGISATAAAANQVKLSWNASTDDVGVAGYTVFRDGAQIGTSTSTSFTDSSVQPGIIYSYHVVAYDAAGRTSDPSNTVTISTSSTTEVLAFRPTDDATVRPDLLATTNYGQATSLEVDNSPVKNFLLKFSLSGIGARTVKSAKLRLYAIDPSDMGGQFRRTVGDSWSEGTVTWANAPAADSTIVTSLGTVATGNWYEVDVTPVVTGDGTVSLGVTSTSTNGADYSSRQGPADRVPELRVTVG